MNAGYLGRVSQPVIFKRWRMLCGFASAIAIVMLITGCRWDGGSQNSSPTASQNPPPPRRRRHRRRRHRHRRRRPAATAATATATAAATAATAATAAEPQWTRRAAQQHDLHRARSRYGQRHHRRGAGLSETLVHKSSPLHAAGAGRFEPLVRGE